VGRSDKELDIEVIQGKEMTEAEIQSVVYLLFSWWRREFEERETKNTLQ
jgi:hypothetical protein